MLLAGMVEQWGYQSSSSSE